MLPPTDRFEPACSSSDLHRVKAFGVRTLNGLDISSARAIIS
jgi:hypothetical protein